MNPCYLSNASAFQAFDGLKRDVTRGIRPLVPGEHVGNFFGKVIQGRRRTMADDQRRASAGHHRVQAAVRAGAEISPHADHKLAFAFGVTHLDTGTRVGIYPVENCHDCIAVVDGIHGEAIHALGAIGAAPFSA